MEHLVSNNAFDPNTASELRAEEASDFSIFEKELSFLHFLVSSHNATAPVSITGTPHCSIWTENDQYYHKLFKELLSPDISRRSNNMQHWPEHILFCIKEMLSLISLVKAKLWISELFKLLNMTAYRCLVCYQHRSRRRMLCRYCHQRRALPSCWPERCWIESLQMCRDCVAFLLVTELRMEGTYVETIIDFL